MTRSVDTEGVEPLYSVLEDEHLVLREGITFFLDLNYQFFGLFQRYNPVPTTQNMRKMTWLFGGNKKKRCENTVIETIEKNYDVKRGRIRINML